MIWLHEDALRSTHPVFARAPEGTPAFYIWDEAYLREMDYSFHRLVFIYESLVELPVTILRGTFDTCLPALAAQNDNRVWTAETPNPGLRGVMESLSGRGVNVSVVSDVPFVTLREEPDLHRFSRYWRRARKAAMCIGGSRPPD